MRLFLPLAILLLLAFSTFADDTVVNDGGNGPEPLNVEAGQEGPVQMVSEELEFHFNSKRTTVIARFHFLNTTKPKLHLTIGFPDPGAVLHGDGAAFQPALEDLKTFVDGIERPSKVEYGWVRWGDNHAGWIPAKDQLHGGFQMAWHTLDLFFPFQQETVVERRYTSKDGNRNDGFYFFEYIVHTGSAWKGNIGKLTARVIMDGGVTVDDLRWIPSNENRSDGLVMLPKKSEWKIVSPTEMTLEWNDFKPSKDPGKRYVRLITRDKERDREWEEYRKQHPNGP
jgi:hypothetical protein